MESINDTLPVELIQLILDQCPVHNRVVFSFVCKLWHTILQPQHEIIDPSKKALITREKVLRKVAFNGELEVLKWLTISGKLSYQQSIKIARKAAKGGHVSILMWIKEKGAGQLDVARLATPALVGGRIEVLQWLKDSEGWRPGKVVCTVAAQKEQLEVLKWLRLKCDCPWDQTVPRAAAQKGNLQMLKWALSNGCPSPSTSTLVCAAVASGNVSMIEWLCETHGEEAKDLARKEGATVTAAEKGHVQMLKWLMKELGAPTPSPSCANCAAHNGDLEMIRFLKELKFNWGDTPAIAAREGHVHLLKWMREEGVQFDERVAELAAERAGLKVLTWLKEIGYPFQPNVLGPHFRTFVSKPLFDWVRENGLLEMNRQILLWLVEQGYHDTAQEFDLKDEFTYSQQELKKFVWSASLKGDKEAVIWARKKGYCWKGCEYQAALDKCQLDFFDWLLEERCDMNQKTLSSLAYNQDLETLKIAKERNIRCKWSCGVFENAVLGYLDKNANEGKNVDSEAKVTELLEWLLANRCPIFSESVCNDLIRAGDVAILEWLTDKKGYPMHKPFACALAIQLGGGLPMLKWLIETANCPWTQEAAESLKNCQDQDVVEYGKTLILRT